MNFQIKVTLLLFTDCEQLIKTSVLVVIFSRWQNETKLLSGEKNNLARDS